MKEDNGYWKKYWNSKGSADLSDDSADRGTGCVCAEIVESTEKHFFDSVNPKWEDLIFDAGCGTGGNISKFSTFSKAMVGIDISIEMVARACRRIKKNGLNNVGLMVGSVDRLAIKSDTFDKVICTSVMQYLNDEDCEEALREFFRITKNNGIVVLHVKNLSSIYGWTLHFAKKAARMLKKPVKPDFYRSSRWYETTIEKLGAQIVDYNSFGLFNITYMPGFLIYWLLKLETKIPKGKFLRRHGVNCQITIKTRKG